MMPVGSPIEFGTDGVRGPAGTWPVDAAGARTIGRAVAAWARGSVAVGRDTRQSGPDLVDAVVAGLNECGVDALDCGVLPTAALSCAVPALGCAAGVMVTASHNPWPDNGLKVLTATGGKLLDPEPVERLCAEAARLGGGKSVNASQAGKRVVVADPTAAWRAALPWVNLSGARVLVDCAHGAAAPFAPAVFRERGAEVVERGCAPDGRNINDGVGALHPPSDLVGCAVGVCLDGDADRVVLVDAVGGLLDGDDLLWLLARDGAGPVVGTTMTNGGLEAALGGRLVRADVGDRFVAAELARTGGAVGAEQSGHVLFADGLPTGDGTYTALRVLAACGSRLPLPVGGWARWPQRHGAVPVPDRDPTRIVELASVARAEQQGLRVVVRFSGTEPKVRVMVEGPGAERVERAVAAILTEIAN